jgi:hypothetical protein
VRRSISCGLSPAGVSRGGLIGLGRRLRRLRCLCGLVRGAVRSTMRCAVRCAVRSGCRRLCLQSRATAAATLHRRWVLKRQETRAVGQVVVGGGRISTTLVEQLKVAGINLEKEAHDN